MKKNKKNSHRLIYKIQANSLDDKKNTSMAKHNCSLKPDNDLEDIKNAPLERFGLLLQYRRQKAGYTAWDFAQKISLDFETLWAVECGFASLEAVRLNINRIASGLNIPPAALRNFLFSLYT
jgi:hypothetical protein